MRERTYHNIRHEADTTIIELREHGCMRLPLAIFMCVWLTGWAIGETIAIRAILRMAEQFAFSSEVEAWFVVAFAAVFLTFWTFGGISGLVLLLRALWGRDELRISRDAWRVRKTVGPIGFTRGVATEGLRAIYVSRKGWLVAETGRRDVLLTRYGAPGELKEIVERYAATINARPAELPRAWRAVPHEDGRTRVERRKLESPGCMLFLALLAVAGAASVHHFRPAMSLAAFVIIVALSALFGALAVWGAFSRRGWLVGPGSVSAWTTFPGYREEVPFDRDSLHLTYSRDSDSDEHFALLGLVNGKKRNIHSGMNDDREVVTLGRFLTRRAGWTLRGDDYPKT